MNSNDIKLFFLLMWPKKLSKKNRVVQKVIWLILHLLILHLLFEYPCIFCCQNAFLLPYNKKNKADDGKSDYAFDDRFIPPFMQFKSIFSVCTTNKSCNKTMKNLQMLTLGSILSFSNINISFTADVHISYDQILFWFEFT